MARRKKGRPVDGWIIVDKPAGLTSTQAVTAVRRAFDAQKAGHAGTLDPLATGVLAIALGEATKTIPFAMDAEKTYVFTARWGVATTTDDAEGTAVETSPHRPAPEDILSALPRFTGTITQVPPAFSAVKVDGERAYDLARAGEVPALKPRTAEIRRAELRACPDTDTAEFEIVCGKGTYVRAFVRDLARVLGTCGHVTALRRTRTGPFGIERAISLAFLKEHAMTPAAGILLPVETALDDIPALAVTGEEVRRLRAGGAAIVRGPLLRSMLEACEKLGIGFEADGDPLTVLCVTPRGEPVALAEYERGELRPARVFNLERKGTADVDYR